MIIINDIFNSINIINFMINIINNMINIIFNIIDIKNIIVNIIMIIIIIIFIIRIIIINIWWESWCWCNKLLSHLKLLNVILKFKSFYYKTKIFVV